VKLNQRSGNGSALIIIYLHDQRIMQHCARGPNLVAAAGLDDCRSRSRGFQLRGRGGISLAARQNGERRKQYPCA
jgi:hypothetical protein